MNNNKHPYWGRLASTTVGYVDHLTNSHDMIIEILPDTRPEEVKSLVDIVPAYYVPSERKIFIDATTAFADETQDIEEYDIDISLKSDRNAYPLFTGMVAHEIGHEKYTRYAFLNKTSTGEPVSDLEKEIVKSLEESRMEKKLLDESPDPACYLSSVVHHVILKSLFEKFILGRFAKNEAITLFLLVKSRLLLGIIPETFIPSSLDSKMNEILGENNVQQASSIIQTIFPIANDDCYDLMVMVAKRIIELFELTEEMPENPCYSHQDQSSEPQTGESNESSSNETKARTSDSADSGENGSPDESAVQDAINGNKEHPKKSPQAELSEEQQKALEEALHEAQRGIPEHQESLRNQEGQSDDKDSNGLHDSKEVTEEEQKNHLNNISSSRNLYEPPLPFTRDIPPAYRDRFYAQKLYQDIRKAQYRADAIITTPVEIPQGKMVMRQAVRRSIQREIGAEITAKPWNKKTVENIVNPPLVMGVAMDVSHSLQRYIAPFMHYMWSLNEAVLMNEGTVNNVLWGNENVTFEHHRQIVKIPTSPFSGQSQGLPNALKKLAHNCNFHHVQGAKVVFVITDSDLPNMEEIVNELRILNALHVKVIWISTTEIHRDIYSKYASYIKMDHPNDFYEIMSPEIVKALEAPMLTTMK